MMILLLVHVDLVNHFANLLYEQHAVLESRFPLIKLILGLHAYRFLNELCRQCVVENNCN